MPETNVKQTNTDLKTEHQRAGINTDIGTVVPESMKNRAELVGAADTFGIRQNYAVGTGTAMSSDKPAVTSDTVQDGIPAFYEDGSGKRMRDLSQDLTAMPQTVGDRALSGTNENISAEGLPEPGQVGITGDVISEPDRKSVV